MRIAAERSFGTEIMHDDKLAVVAQLHIQFGAVAAQPDRFGKGMHCILRPKPRAASVCNRQRPHWVHIAEFICDLENAIAAWVIIV